MSRGREVGIPFVVDIIIPGREIYRADRENACCYIIPGIRKEPIIETDETVEDGAAVDIQIKDIGKWAVGEALAAGTELAADAEPVRPSSEKTPDFSTAAAV